MNKKGVFPVLSPTDIERLHLCRICRGEIRLHKDADGRLIPFVFNFGKEHAHQDCIDRVISLGYDLPPYLSVKLSRSGD